MMMGGGRKGTPPGQGGGQVVPVDNGGMYPGMGGQGMMPPWRRAGFEALAGMPAARGPMNFQQPVPVGRHHIYGMAGNVPLFGHGGGQGGPDVTSIGTGFTSTKPQQPETPKRKRTKEEELQRRQDRRDD